MMCRFFLSVACYPNPIPPVQYGPATHYTAARYHLIVTKSTKTQKKVTLKTCPNFFGNIETGFNQSCFRVHIQILD